MKTRGLVLGLVFVGALAACGEIVGLGDRDSFLPHDAGVDAPHSSADADADAADSLGASDASPPPDPHYACGISAGTIACQACMTSSCCPENEACADSGTCSDYENCLVPCGGDYACRAECLILHPPQAVEIASVNSCVAMNCAQACGTTCAMTDSFAEPDAADTCASCLSTTPHGCADWQACERDPECAEISLCVANCTTQDCQSTCGYGHDAGATLFLSTLLDSVMCLGQCGIGSYWECVGKFEPVFLQADETVLTLALTDASGAAGAGISVTACPNADDSSCSQPVDAQITDASGTVTLHLPTHGQIDGYGVGFDGYFEISGAGVIPQLSFLEFPLSEPAATLSVALADESTLAMLYSDANVPREDESATVWVNAVDCHWLPSTGVTVRATGAGGDTLPVVYGAGAPVTGLLGAAYVLNAPQNVTLEVDVPNVGVAANSVVVFTRPGSVSSIVVHPNNYDPGPSPIDGGRQRR